MILQNSNNQNKRLLGIDLFKGIAAYGVVIIHGLGEIPRNQSALLISNFFVAFCVPFFLVASFYFSTKALLSKNTNNYLKNRLERIIIPYFAWTVIYLLARLVGCLIGNKESFERLITDPININYIFRCFWSAVILFTNVILRYYSRNYNNKSSRKYSEYFFAFPLFIFKYLSF